MHKLRRVRIAVFFPHFIDKTREPGAMLEVTPVYCLDTEVGDLDLLFRSALHLAKIYIAHAVFFYVLGGTNLLQMMKLSSSPVGALNRP